MGRPTMHALDDMLDAARTLLLRHGVEQLTVQAIAEACGAPVGSLYNRFGSRRALLSQVWIRAARKSQAACMIALEHDDPLEAALESVRRMIAFTREHPDDARLLASFRREDLLDQEQAPELNEPVEIAFKQLSKRLYGNARSESLRRVWLALLDLPLSAMRRYLLAGRTVPHDLDAHLERAARAILVD